MRDGVAISSVVGSSPDAEFVAKLVPIEAIQVTLLAVQDLLEGRLGIS